MILLTVIFENSVIGPNDLRAYILNNVFRFLYERFVVFDFARVFSDDDFSANLSLNLMKIDYI